jgi:hypothetical protein
MNRVALMEYVKDNHLSSEKNRSWEKAYKNLKNDGKLTLQSTTPDGLECPCNRTGARDSAQCRAVWACK